MLDLQTSLKNLALPTATIKNVNYKINTLPVHPDGANLARLTANTGFQLVMGAMLSEKEKFEDVFAINQMLEKLSELPNEQWEKIANLSLKAIEKQVGNNYLSLMINNTLAYELDLGLYYELILRSLIVNLAPLFYHLNTSTSLFDSQADLPTEQV